jgi:hypothetical protein
MQTWIMEELQTAKLGDERLNDRFRLVLDRFSDKPSLSIPAACRGLSETHAAYRFFDNERVTPATILQPHQDATVERIRQQPVVLIPQDTTELDFTRRQEKVGGPLSSENQIGFHAHVLLALTPERIALGVVGAEIWARDPEDFHKRHEKAQKPIEEKESYRWLEGYRRACALAQAAPTTRVISLSDSEGDIFECFEAAQPEEGLRKADWIVRAGQDRSLVAASGNLFEEVARTPVLATVDVEVSKRHGPAGGDKRRRGREARTARCTVQKARVQLKAPWRKGRRLSNQFVNVVLVREVEPPPGEEPIEWLLLTNLSIDIVEQVQQVVAYYCCRWEIEIYFRVLKSGCQVEDLQLETAERMQACVAVYLIVAWRVLHVLMMGRQCPDLPCTAVFTDEEWQSVYRIVKRQPVPAQVPRLEEVVEWVAQLGGYLGRKHDGPPGPKTLWIGLQRTRDYALAWNAFGPGSPTAGRDRRTSRRTCVER